MFGGLGFWEISIILGIALIILGPTKLPEMARSFGKGLREFRKATEEFKSTIDTEIHRPDPPKASARIESPKSKTVPSPSTADSAVAAAAPVAASAPAEAPAAAGAAVAASAGDTEPDEAKTAVVESEAADSDGPQVRAEPMAVAREDEPEDSGARDAGPDKATA